MDCIKTAQVIVQRVSKPSGFCSIQLSDIPLYSTLPYFCLIKHSCTAACGNYYPEPQCFRNIFTIFAVRFHHVINLLQEQKGILSNKMLL